jgi:putative ABC transport system substrate-binding protein
MPRHIVWLLVTLTLGILVVPMAAAAQRAEPVPRIGYLRSGSAASQRGQHLQDVFRQGLRELGWVEGQNIAIEERWAEGRPERFPALAAELVRLSVDVLVGGGNQAIQALRHATSTIPIVMAVSSDPVGVGLVTSLARPGGNITGVSIQAAEVGGKRLELLKEAVPRASRVAALWNASDASKASELHDTQVAAHALGMTLYSAEVRGPNDFDRAFAVILRERPDVLLTFSDPLTLNHQRRIVDFAARHRLPLMSEAKEFAEAGGLMTYGASLPALVRRAAYYVDRILKGSKPADLPVERPTKFELVLNLKTAKALGITMPPSLLLLADEVIQ